MVPKEHEEIIMKALQVYRKLFEDDTAKLQEIDMAINSLNQNKEFFSITSICKDDIFHIFEDDDQAQEIIKKMDDEDMKHLASKMGDDYCEQLFWDSLSAIFELTFSKSKEVKNNVE